MATNPFIDLKKEFEEALPNQNLRWNSSIYHTKQFLLTYPNSSSIGYTKFDVWNKLKPQGIKKALIVKEKYEKKEDSHIHVLVEFNNEIRGRQKSINRLFDIPIKDKLIHGHYLPLTGNTICIKFYLLKEDKIPFVFHFTEFELIEMKNKNPHIENFQILSLEDNLIEEISIKDISSDLKQNERIYEQEIGLEQINLFLNKRNNMLFEEPISENMLNSIFDIDNILVVYTYAELSCFLEKKNKKENEEKNIKIIIFNDINFKKEDFLTRECIKNIIKDRKNNNMVFPLNNGFGKLPDDIILIILTKDKEFFIMMQEMKRQYPNINLEIFQKNITQSNININIGNTVVNNNQTINNYLFSDLQEEVQFLRKKVENFEKTTEFLISEMKQLKKQNVFQTVIPPKEVIDFD